MHRATIIHRVATELCRKAQHCRALTTTILESCNHGDTVLARTTIEIEIGHQQRSTAVDALRLYAHEHRVATAVVDIELNICNDKARILHSLRLTLEDDVVTARVERERHAGLRGNYKTSSNCTEQIVYRLVCSKVKDRIVISTTQRRVACLALRGVIVEQRHVCLQRVIKVVIDIAVARLTAEVEVEEVRPTLHILLMRVAVEVNTEAV